MSVHHTNLLKIILTVAADEPVYLSPEEQKAVRWALSMINALGEEVADQSGLPIPEVLQRVSDIVEQSEEFNWSA
jgi:hypothetical protein